jgi:hypothetical protein
LRYVTALLVLAGALALGRPALAVDTRLAKASVEEIKAACEKAGGTFSQDAHSYGCGTDCRGKPGTSCTVNCRNDEKNCFAQVTRGRRPHSLADALTRGVR